MIFKKNIYNVLGFVVSLTFLFILFRNVDLEKILSIVSQVNPFVAILVASLSVLLIVLKTVRWKWTLNKYDNISYKKLFIVNMLTHFFNIIMPFRTGEVVQVLITKKLTNTSKTKLTGTVILNKFFELASIMFIFFILMFYIDIPVVWRGLLKFLIAFVLIFIFLFAFDFIKIPKHNGSSRIFSKLFELLDSLKLLKDKKLLLKSILFSLIIWSVELVMIEILLDGMHIILPLWASLLVLSSINLAILIPASSANLGTYEYAIVLALSVFSIDKNTALSFAVVLHFLEIIFVLLIGLFYNIGIKKHLLGDIDVSKTA